MKSPISLIRVSITFYPSYAIEDKRVMRNYDQIMTVHVTFNENFIYHILRNGNNEVFCCCRGSQKSWYESVEVTVVFQLRAIEVNQESHNKIYLRLNWKIYGHDYFSIPFSKFSQGQWKIM